MQHQQRLSPAEQELASALGALAPAQPVIERDEVLYQAGLAAGRRTARRWRGVSAALAACLLAAITLPAQRTTPPQPPAPVAVERNIAPPVAVETQIEPAPEPREAMIAVGRYAQLRNAVLAHGMSALPPMTDSDPEPPLTVRNAMLALRIPLLQPQ
jgi:hypothetical protein